jgi:hypothetical protein
MAFSSVKILEDVLKKYEISYERKVFSDVKSRKAPTSLKKEVAFSLNEMPYDSSEAFICETLIFPVMREVWRVFKEDFMLWSHRPIVVSPELSGTPDYLIAKRSKLGMIFLETPYVAVVEAKKDDFTGGWGQCSLEMYALQQLNQAPQTTVYGIVSNGDSWEFAALTDKQFTKFTQEYKIQEIDAIFSLICHMLELSKKKSAESEPPKRAAAMALTP